MLARGHSVRSAPTGPKALEAFAASRPDIVLLDINLPGGIDGLEVCRHLKEAAEEDKLPLFTIIISAMDDAETRQRALDAGAVAYYTKPFSPTALLKEIDAIARRHSA